MVETMVLSNVKNELFLRRKLLEARFAKGRGGRGFWLFLFNILASWGVVLWFCLSLTVSFRNPVFVVFGIVAFVTFGTIFDITNAWLRVCGVKK